MPRTCTSSSGKQRHEFLHWGWASVPHSAVDASDPWMSSLEKFQQEWAQHMLTLQATLSYVDGSEDVSDVGCEEVSHFAKWYGLPLDFPSGLSGAEAWRCTLMCHTFAFLHDRPYQELYYSFHKYIHTYMWHLLICCLFLYAPFVHRQCLLCHTGGIVCCLAQQHKSAV